MSAKRWEIQIALGRDYGDMKIWESEYSCLHNSGNRTLTEELMRQITSSPVIFFKVNDLVENKR